MPGSVHHREDLDAGDIASQLREAMSGFGTNEETIVNIIGNHTNAQREEIATAFKTAYGKDLSEDLKSELGGDFEECVLALLTPARKYDAIKLHEAISGVGTDEGSIIDILCTKTNSEIEEIKEVYKAEYENALEDDLCGDNSGYFRRLLVSLLAAGRETDEWFADADRAQEDAQKFFDAGDARWGTEEAELNAILCLRSYCQLIETFNAFPEIAGKSIEESIEEECGGDLKEGYLAIVGCVRDKPAFFARRIKEACAGMGTNDSDLIRIIVSRSEIDMEEIKEAFMAKYESSVEETIESECGGDYKRMLLAVVRLQE